MLRSGIAAIRRDKPIARAASATIVVATLAAGVDAGLWLVALTGMLSIALQHAPRQQEVGDAAA
jgi:hypothetical protein